MKVFKDGKTYCVTLDDFINIQESPSIWFDEDSGVGQVFMNEGMHILSLPVGQVRDIRLSLKQLKVMMAKYNESEDA